MRFTVTQTEVGLLIRDAVPDAVPGHGRRLRPIHIACIGVFLLAAFLRLGFVDDVYRQWRTLTPAETSSRAISFLSPDGPSYLQPARAALGGKIWRAGSVRRPPGYPLFLDAAGVRYPLILAAQALLGAATAVVIALLVHALTDRPLLALLAGLLSAASPTGVGLTGLIMSDLLLTALVAGGLWLLVAAARRRSRGALYGAAALFGAGSLVKPVLLLWPPVAVGLLWIFAGGSFRTFRARTLVLFAALQLAPMVLWSARNRVTDGVFALSDIGTITIREYLMARAESWALAARSPTREEILKRRAVAERGWDSIPDMAGRLRRYRDESRVIASTYPAATARAFAQDILENTSGGWGRFDKQLPRGGAVYEVAQRAAGVETDARAAVPALLALALLFLAGRARFTRSPPERRRLMDAVGMVVAWGYFVVLSGVTFWQGPRILYPATAAMLATMMIGADSVLTLWQRKPQEARQESPGTGPRHGAPA